MNGSTITSELASIPSISLIIQKSTNYCNGKTNEEQKAIRSEYYQNRGHIDKCTDIICAFLSLKRNIPTWHSLMWMNS